MEKSDIVKVIPSNISWSDVGSFDALFEELPKDKNNNTKNENHISIDSKNNLIYGNDKLIATVDVEDLIIVDTGDALLISKKGSSQKVKKVVEKLKANDSQLHNIHQTAYRPWGTYTVLEESAGYKIKRIEVKPGCRLSLQKHFHRNEHWIVVSGTATVTVGNETRLVRPNESTYIKMGEIHRLENQGKIPVVLIEAQVGEYTGEDDIVRINDEYGRE
jgi:mannose-1-phosphate guanylyltransferase